MARADLSRLDEAIASYQSEALPTRQSIAAARAARDDAIAELTPDAMERGIARVQTLVHAADILADTVLREAERLARLTASMDRRATLALEISRLEQELSDAEHALAALHSDYEVLFRKAGIDALDPAHMADWLTTRPFAHRGARRNRNRRRTHRRRPTHGTRT